MAENLVSEIQLGLAYADETVIAVPTANMRGHNLTAWIFQTAAYAGTATVAFDYADESSVTPGTPDAATWTAVATGGPGETAGTLTVDIDATSLPKAQAIAVPCFGAFIRAKIGGGEDGAGLAVVIAGHSATAPKL